MFGRTAVLCLCILAAVSPDAALRESTPMLMAGVPGPPVGRAAAAAPSPGAAAAPAAGADSSPSRLVIARIGVNAKIEARGLDANRNMATPNDFHDVAWYDMGPTPGELGNALINGHVDWWTGSAVFIRLHELRTGDSVTVIRGDGTSLTFKVTGRQTVAAGARVGSLFAPSRVASLTLITCTGVWDPLTLTDTQRLLVSAVLA